MDTVSTSEAPTVGVTQWRSTGASSATHKTSAIDEQRDAGPVPAEHGEPCAEHGRAGDGGQRGGGAHVGAKARAVARGAGREQHGKR